MKPVPCIPALTAVLLLWGSGPLAGAETPPLQTPPGRSDAQTGDSFSLRCQTKELTRPVDAPGVATIQRWIREQRIAAGGVVPIRFHVIQADFGSGVLGTVDQSQLDQTIQVLNNAFAGKGYDGVQVPGAAATGYTFSQLSVDYTLNNDWYGMAMGSREERAAKTALGRDPDGSLNFYTCGIGASGWATFPWDLRRNGVQDGVVVGWVSLPGATYLGGIPIHEVGHWVGLYHTFEGGCHADKFCGTKGDRVCDTPAEGSATSGCPGGKDTCSGLGPDPIHNYMDYSADACDDNFTPGQDARMDFMMAQYRPFIGAARLANTIGRTEPSMPAGYGDHGLRVFPNPSNPSADIQFTLVRDGRVSLRVFDVAGRQVAVLINRYLPAGAHIEVLDGAGLASGAYLVQLRAEGRTEVRRVMILK